MINQSLKIITESSKIILPELLLGVGLLILVFITAIDKNHKKDNLIFWFSMALLLFYNFFSINHYEKLLYVKPIIRAFGNMIYIDKASLLFKQLISLASFVFFVHVRLFKYKYTGEIYLLIFSIMLGLCVLTMSTHFMVIFIGLELVSISSYLLVAANKEKQNFEAGIKYLIFGATTTCIMLFGISLYYGISHILDFADPLFVVNIKSNSGLILQVIAFLFLGALMFKTAAAPFHNWVADVYESTPAPLVSYLSYAPKAAAFLLFARFIYFSPIDLEFVIIFIAVLSLTIGNLSALWQSNSKRMLGYSGIAQSGFILIGLLKHESSDFYGAYFYILAYLPISMGSFFLVDLIYKYTNSFEITEYKGLGQKNILLGINAVIIMMALVGLPPTVGFLGKLMIFTSITATSSSVGQSYYYALLIFGLLNAAVSIYYYLKIPYYMLVKGSYEKRNQEANSFLTIMLSYFSAAIIIFFFFPDFLSNAVNGILF
jgi:NADH-quinone oxidoreductase subunit N